MADLAGLISNHGSARAVNGATVSIVPASRKYRQVKISIKENQILFLDCYYVSPMAKKPLESGYYRFTDGELVKIDYREDTSSKYPHEIYEELADPKNYQG